MIEFVNLDDKISRQIKNLTLIQVNDAFKVANITIRKTKKWWLYNWDNTNFKQKICQSKTIFFEANKQQWIFKF